MEKLTREEIEKMTPEQLRLAVAERIFNLKAFVVPVGGYEFIHREYLDPGECWYWTSDNYQEVLPNYPEDIAAAWLVAEKIMKLEGIENNIVDNFQHAMELSSRHAVSLWGRSAAEAAAIICRAALIAVSN